MAKKANRWSILSSLIVILVLFVGCNAKPTSITKNSDSFYYPSWDEPLYGTWINYDYPEGSYNRNPKTVIHNSGYLEAFLKITDTTAPESGVMVIIKKWTDPQGNVWYKTFFRANAPGDTLWLFRISKNNSVSESIFCQANISGCEESLIEANLAPNNPHYRIYNRQVP
jgi:hypothetical protein